MNTINAFIIDSDLLKKIPASPGVYQFRDKLGKIIYIGKAKDLKSRVGQYVSRSDLRLMIENLMSQAASVEIILTNSESEALILESSLIKKKRPFFNIDLKDDKSYPYLAVTDEEWPRLIITRHINRKYRYLRGPFTSATLLRSLKSLLQVLYPLKYCSEKNPAGCINFQMGLCPAPCRKNTDKTVYDNNVRNIIEILQGKKWKELNDLIKENIETSSQVLNFEKAAKLRDLLAMIPEIKKKFSVEFSGTGVSDFFMLRKQGEIQFFAVARYHDGALNSLRTFTVTAITDEIESSVASALATFYSGNSKAEKIFIYPNVLNNEQIEQVSGFNVKKSGAIPKTIMKILETNIDSAMKNYIRDTQSRGIMLNELSEFVNAEITSIMCLDISTFGGEFTVAGAVWWEKGKFVKNNYRKFRIRTVEGIDDFGSLKEVASRLMKKWKENSFPVPSLLLIDGGAGQISSVYSVVGEFLPVAGIVKDRRNLKGHELLLNSSGEEMLLNDSIFALTMKSIRDETHRFSISFNKNLRKSKLTSALAQIEGIGKSRELALLQHFRTIANIRSATIEELMEVKGINRKLAQKIHSSLIG